MPARPPRPARNAPDELPAIHHLARQRPARPARALAPARPRRLPHAHLRALPPLRPQRRRPHRLAARLARKPASARGQPAARWPAGIRDRSRFSRVNFSVSIPLKICPQTQSE
ncbi:hypothetical protein ADJ79_11175 [Ottowia sp. oral taxon 894]|nr:hypothetical protein ADJ79_11175 [Ottowia sp. oral taxon 894]